VNQSKLPFLATGLLLCVLTQITQPLLTGRTIVSRPVSYSPNDAISSPSGSMARTKEIKIACYPVWGECTKDSDCCTGFCRVGRVTAYCDNK
jgi:hypothetical protein